MLLLSKASSRFSFYTSFSCHNSISLQVYLDKECKYGNVDHARSMLEKKVEERKLSDRQMKSIFKKWYRMEEEHGTQETQEHVKESARAYVSTK